ncbi:MAG: 4-hydroxy-tetrahydrodipicolinate reductase [Treponema sp.]|jgi:4-hydroxy-tetrahydrodipicolinate reductase|nr:4-hydroxy-tetrahydrodipicolinate reductase [Treponema sp.]
MNIAIIGCGKMGRIVERAARERGHRVSVVVDPFITGSEVPAGTLLRKTVEEAENLHEADVAIEFSQPGAAADNIKALAKRRIPAVSGTTGWYGRMDEVKEAVNAAGSSLLWAANFSLGVNIFYRIAFNAAALMDPFDEYDAGGFEAHHNKKADSPSGTAKTLAEGIIKRMERKKKPVYETLDRPPLPGEFHFPSLRVGSLPGTHALVFDSPADTIEIRHTARSREGFASGALVAAQWLVKCPGPGQAAGGARRGVFTMDDVLDELGVKSTK